MFYLTAFSKDYKATLWVQEFDDFEVAYAAYHATKAMTNRQMLLELSVLVEAEGITQTLARRQASK